MKNDIAGNALYITMNSNSKQKLIAISGYLNTVHLVGSYQTRIEDSKIYGPECADCNAV